MRGEDRLGQRVLAESLYRALGLADRRASWPGSVGTAFLIVQHAVHDTALMRAMLPAIEASFRRGELDGGAVASAVGAPRGSGRAVDGGRSAGQVV
jgi:hypothetical protein